VEWAARSTSRYGGILWLRRSASPVIRRGAFIIDTTRHQGSVVIVTGGASGIGRACAERLVAEGAQVVIADIDEARAADAAKALSAAGDTADRDGTAVGVAVDVRSRSGCAAMAEAALAAFGSLTGLVHAAGVNQPPHSITEFTEDEWRRVIDINLTGTLWAIQAVAPHLGEGGAIVTLASGQARVVRRNSAAYAASKAGVLAITKVAALELGARGVRVNSIVPGFIDTEMNRAKLTPERRAAIERGTPLKRVGDPREIAKVASFLLSSDSSYMTGDLIAVDGGVAAPSRT
jgi:NAD(P)-dependent dehydrogenase (short-subunit alcohol dehydrogenase family)